MLVARGTFRELEIDIQHTSCQKTYKGPCKTGRYIENQRPAYPDPCIRGKYLFTVATVETGHFALCMSTPVERMRAFRMMQHGPTTKHQPLGKRLGCRIVIPENDNANSRACSEPCTNGGNIENANVNIKRRV